MVFAMNNKDKLQLLEERIASDYQTVRLQLIDHHYDKSFIQQCLQQIKLDVPLVDIGMKEFSPLEKLGLKLLLDSAEMQ